jgi:hypothetical protein
MPRALAGSLFLISGLAAGVACTAVTSSSRKDGLPHAGDAKDDGTGVLARWSRGQTGLGGGCGAGQNCGQQPYDDYYGGGDGYDQSGGGYYGGAYGGSYGGYGYNQYHYQYQYVAPPPPVIPGYTVTAVHNPGVIEGVISWKNAPKAVAQITPKDKDKNRCGVLANPSLSVSTSTKGVANTVVYLSDIKLGKMSSLLGGTVEEKGCTFSPHVQVAAPIGVTLQIMNRDSHATTITVKGTAKDLVQNLAFPAMRQRDVPLDAAGEYQVSAADHPASTAWVVVPGTPYYVVSDADGYFRLDDVPAGEYTLVAWHEPVITGVDANGAAVYGQPVEVKMHVKVSPSGTITQNIDLGTTK